MSSIIFCPEYDLLMKAVRLREVDRDYRNHLQAFLNFSVRAMKKSGTNRQRPVYSRFDKFYDYNAELKKIEDPSKRKDKYKKLKAHLKKKGG